MMHHSVLRIAGQVKRGSPKLDEPTVLMRALRDCNAPKIVARDMPTFLTLVSDLFPEATVEAVADDDLVEKCQVLLVCTQLACMHGLVMARVVR